MSAQRIGVTGATGGVGGRVATRLAEHGVPQLLLVRDAARAPSLPRADVAVFGGYQDADGMRRALAGIETLFLVSAGEDPARVLVHKTAVDAALAAGAGPGGYT